MEKVEVTYHSINNRPSYKHFHGSFKDNIIDYHLGKERPEPSDKDSFIEYCSRNFNYILRNNDYSHVFQISKRFLKFFECNSQTEFEEKVLIPLLRILCVKYEQDFEQLQEKIFENECISYNEDFN